MAEYVELPDATVALAVVHGLMYWNAAEDVYELTPKGAEQIREWAREELANQPKERD